MEASCVLCQEVEDVEHLFFHCTVLLAIRDAVLQRMGLQVTSKRMKELHNWVLHSKRLTGAQRKMVGAALACSLLYGVQLRNLICFQGKEVVVDAAIQHTTQQLKSKMEFLQKIRKKTLNTLLM